MVGKRLIFSPNLAENQCTGNVFNRRNIKTKRELTRLIKDYYEITAYQSFGNMIKNMIKKSIMKYPNLSEIEREKRVIQDYFSDRLFIIDEAHNLRDDGEKDNHQDTIVMIEKVIKYSKNMKLILLSATPMYNRSTEIIRLLNFLLMNDNRHLIQKKDILKDRENFMREN